MGGKLQVKAGINEYRVSLQLYADSIEMLPESGWRNLAIAIKAEQNGQFHARIRAHALDE